MSNSPSSSIVGGAIIAGLGGLSLALALVGGGSPTSFLCLLAGIALLLWGQVLVLSGTIAHGILLAQRVRDHQELAAYAALDARDAD